MLLFLFLLVNIAYAQEGNNNESNEIELNNTHEFRIDVLEALAVLNFEIDYEYIISKYSGAGAAISYSFDNSSDFDQKFSFTPYYRQYFFNKKEYGARGFFVEGLLQAATGKDYDSFYIYDDVNEGYTYEENNENLT